MLMFDFTAMMTTKLVLLKLLSCGRRFPQKSTETVNAIGKAVVVLKLEGDEVSIENSPLVAVSSHQAWTTFQEVCRKMLGAKDVLLFRLEGSSGRPLNNMSTLLKEPSNVLNVTVTEILKDSVSLSSNSCPDVSKQDRVDFSSLDDVLRRTQELCQSLSSLQIDGRSSPGVKSSNERSQIVRSLDDLTTRSLPTVDSQSTSVLLNECDAEVEHLLKLSESIASSEHKDASQKLLHFPDAPSKVGIIKNFQGGVFVVWDPVKLDGNERNNGHRVTGYCIALNGQLMRTTKGPLMCQTEINDLLPSKKYCVQICTCAEMCNSTFSPPTYFTTKFEGKSGKVLPLTRSQSVRDSHHHRQSLSSSENDLVSYQMGLPHHFASMNKRCRSESARPVIIQDTSTPLSSRSSSPATTTCFQEEDNHSTSSGTTSGICTDYSMSLKSSLPRSRHASSSPSPLALKTYIFTRPDISRSKPNPTTEVSINDSHLKPEPPIDVRVHINGTMMSLSWKPVSRGSKSANNGQCVLGYRVYVNDHPVACVDGAATNFVLVDLPRWLLSQRLDVDVRTRTISSESTPSPCALYLSLADLQQFCAQPLNSNGPRCETCV